MVVGGRAGGYTRVMSWDCVCGVVDRDRGPSDELFVHHVTFGFCTDFFTRARLPNIHFGGKPPATCQGAGRARGAGVESFLDLAARAARRDV